MSWKAGDMAMVKIVQVDSDGDVWIKGGGDRKCLRPTDVRPLPPAITPEESAVVEAALKWGKTNAPVNYVGDALAAAVLSLIVSRTPPDPLAELVAALDHITIGPGFQAGETKAVGRYKTAIEAARKAVAK